MEKNTLIKMHVYINRINYNNTHMKKYVLIKYNEFFYNRYGQYFVEI